MEHCRLKRPGDTTGAGRVWTDQGLARNGGDQSTCVLVAGQSVGSGNKGFDEAERSRSEAGKNSWSVQPSYCSRLLDLDVRRMPAFGMGKHLLSIPIGTQSIQVDPNKSFIFTI